LIKISDFGLARLQVPDVDFNKSPVVGTILTRENTVMGTPDFLSPEQARNLHNTDIRSDIYSLGCTFYFLLTGSVPFPGGKAMEKLIRHYGEQPQAVTLFREDVPELVLAILNKMLAKRPADRYQTPAELGVALEPYAVSGPIPWAPPPVPLSLPEAITETGEIPPADSFDSMPALTTTVSQGYSPTPLLTPPIVRARRTVKKPAAGKQLTLWLWLAAAALLGLVAGVVVVSLFLN
jgi:eukaryotic-like serine/threonine-protein kinase